MKNYDKFLQKNEKRVSDTESSIESLEVQKNETENRIRYLQGVISTKNLQKKTVKISLMLFGIFFVVAIVPQALALNSVTDLFTIPQQLDSLLYTLVFDGIIVGSTGTLAYISAKDEYCKKYEKNIIDKSLKCSDAKKAQRELENKKDKKESLVTLIDLKKALIEDVKLVCELIKLYNENTLDGQPNSFALYIKNQINSCKAYQDFLKSEEKNTKFFKKGCEINKERVEEELEKYFHEPAYMTHFDSFVEEPIKLTLNKK